MTLHDDVLYYSIYRRYAKADGSCGIGIGLIERFQVRTLASPRTDMSRTVSLSHYGVIG